MNKACLLFVLIFAFTFSSRAQQDPTYIEVAGGGKFRFHYNEQYFLVDKDCEFLSRIRISGMTAEKHFTGPFTDYDADGATIMTGNYEDGIKNGTFRVFYPGGFLKWQGDFRANRPSGTWNFYHPDGRPRMILEFMGDTTYVREYWNENGKQEVKNGNGTFFLRDFQFGYNGTGHEALLYRGKIRGGLPEGRWLVHYQFPGGDTEEAAAVVFKNGISRGVTPIRFMESEFFPNAESLIGKNCVVDDQVNFSEYLRNHLNLTFDFADFTTANTPPAIEATLTVTSDGQPRDVTIRTAVGRSAESNLKARFYGISYWVPSQKDGEVIDDRLSVFIEVLKDENGAISFGYPSITRANGK